MMRTRTWTRPLTWWQARRLHRRARRQTDARDLPRLLGVSTAYLRQSEAIDRLHRSGPPLAAWLNELRRCVPRVARDQQRWLDRLDAADRAAGQRRANDLAIVIWVVSWIPVTALDFVLSEMLVSRLVAEADDVQVWGAIGAIAVGTLLVGHEVGSAVQAWRSAPGRPSAPDRRRLIASVVFAAVFAAVIGAAIAATPSRGVTYLSAFVVLFIPTMLYSVKPDGELFARLSTRRAERIARRRLRRSAAAATVLAERVVDGYNRTVTCWWAEMSRVDAALASWDTAAARPDPHDAGRSLASLAAAGIIVARADIDAVLDELAACEVVVERPVRFLRRPPRAQRRVAVA